MEEVEVQLEMRDLWNKLSIPLSNCFVSKIITCFVFTEV